MMMIEINRGKRFYNIAYKEREVTIKYDTLSNGGFLLIFKQEHKIRIISCEGFRIIGSSGMEYNYEP